MDTVYHVLILVDTETLFDAIRDRLQALEQAVAFTPLPSLANWQAAISDQLFTCVIIEYAAERLPTITKIKQDSPFLPVVVVCENLSDEQSVVAAIKAGADDYVTQSNLKRLEQILQKRDSDLVQHRPLFGAEMPPLYNPETLLIQRNRELALINSLGQTFASTHDLDQVLQTVLEEVRRLLGVVACSIWLVDADSKELCCRQATDPEAAKVRGWRLPFGTGLVGWVAENGRSLVVSDTHTDPRHFKGVDKETKLRLRSILSTPLRVKNEVIGVLQVVDTAVARFDWSDLFLLESLASTTAIAIENIRLYEQAHQDAETKARLLREVNHRVKNNLSSIIGLLYAQLRGRKVTDYQSYRAQMQEIIARVQGLATVHSLLSDAEWTPILLSDLATQIVHSALQASPIDHRIQVNIPKLPILVDPKQANSLALVFNELVTNTIKYAFSAKEEGHIFIEASVEAANFEDDPHKGKIVVIKYHDNGTGYPTHILKLENINVGLYLMQMIIRKDLNGTLTLLNEPGATAVITFRATTANMTQLA